MMIGTIVNTCTIIVGSIVGALMHKGIKEKYKEALYTGLGLVCLGIGLNAVISNFTKSEYPVLFIVSIAIGSVIGTALDIDGRFSRLINKRANSKNSSDIAKGLSTAILLYCIGTLSIVGPVMSALYGDNTYLFTNATLDLVTSAVLATTYGIGMLWAAPVLFLWQGAIYLLTVLAGNIIPTPLVTEISVVGGVLIAASGFSILGIKDCKTINMLPALVVPVLFFILKSFI